MCVYVTGLRSPGVAKKDAPPPGPSQTPTPLQDGCESLVLVGVRPGHHLREGAKGLLHVASRSDHYVLGWDKVWEDPPLPDPFTRGSNFEPYLVWPGVSRNPHPGFG